MIAEIDKEEREYFMGNCYHDPNQFTGTDSDRMEQAISEALKSNGIVRIPPRIPDAESSRNFWLLDRAILLPSNLTLMLENCRLKLADTARDNLMRSANCGLGIQEIHPVTNLRIIGIGNVVLEGADRPRSTGDWSKTLGVRTFGTDAGKPGENPNGDWRNIGILLAEVQNFMVSGLTIRDSHSWAMSLEYCSNGKIRDMAFYSNGWKLIDGKKETVLNQDGLDLRRGCRGIVVENITGATGDDLLAMTAIKGDVVPPGIAEATEVTPLAADDRENDLCHIMIRNVLGHSAGGHQIVRFLNASGIRIHHVLLDGVIDNSPDDCRNLVTVRIGDRVAAWGGITPLGDTHDLQIRNIQSRAQRAVSIVGSLTDSVIDGVINDNPETDPVHYESGRENTRNLILTNLLTRPAPQSPKAN